MTSACAAVSTPAAELADDLRRGLARAAAATPAPDRPASRLGARGGAILLVAMALALTVTDAATSDAACAAQTTAAALTSGSWTGDFGDMVFAVDGDNVVATHDHDRGRFEGTIHGARVIGHWCEAPYATAQDTGDAVFALSVRGGDARAAGGSATATTRSGPVAGTSGGSRVDRGPISNIASRPRRGRARPGHDSSRVVDDRAVPCRKRGHTSAPT